MIGIADGRNSHAGIENWRGADELTVAVGGRDEHVAQCIDRVCILARSLARVSRNRRVD